MGNTTLGTIYMVSSISPQLSRYGIECVDGDSCFTAVRNHIMTVKQKTSYVFK